MFYVEKDTARARRVEKEMKWKKKFPVLLFFWTFCRWCCFFAVLCVCLHFIKDNECIRVWGEGKVYSRFTCKNNLLIKKDSFV